MKVFSGNSILAIFLATSSKLVSGCVPKYVSGDIIFPGSKFNVVEGDPQRYSSCGDSGKAGKRYCWKLDGKTKNAKIVLAKCNPKDNFQLFEYVVPRDEENGEEIYVGESIYIKFRPKVNRNLLVGIKKVKNNSVLQLVDPDDDVSSHLFYIDEHGTMGIGQEDVCGGAWGGCCTMEYGSGPKRCLYVSHSGKKANSGNIVALKSRKYLEGAKEEGKKLIDAWIDY